MEGSKRALGASWGGYGALKGLLGGPGGDVRVHGGVRRGVGIQWGLKGLGGLLERGAGGPLGELRRKLREIRRGFDGIRDKWGIRGEAGGRGATAGRLWRPPRGSFGGVSLPSLSVSPRATQPH